MESIPIGLIIKQIVKEKKVSVIDIANKLSVSRQAVYQTFSRDKMNLEERKVWAMALGVDVSEFDKRSVNNTSSESNEYLQEYLEKLEIQFDRLLNQLETKDRQIEKLMDLLGKRDGVVEETQTLPLWPEVEIQAGA